jgi:hypothetical protein
VRAKRQDDVLCSCKWRKMNKKKIAHTYYFFFVDKPHGGTDERTNGDRWVDLGEQE